ncbi:MAG: hypothetical protein MI717_01440, partial [Spirochaetales bacterium]|nr:hypothetical protein [Spirochaetales bacterium]
LIFNRSKNHYTYRIDSINLEINTGEKRKIATLNYANYEGVSNKFKLSELYILSDKFNFTYNEEYLGKVLPSIYSSGVDHWGYYNGIDSNKSLAYELDDESKSKLSNINFSKFSYANRTPNLEFAKLGLLKSIYYPGGGYSELDYEFNTYSNKLSPFKNVKSNFINFKYNYNKDDKGLISETILSYPFDNRNDYESCVINKNLELYFNSLRNNINYSNELVLEREQTVNIVTNINFLAHIFFDYAKTMSADPRNNPNYIKQFFLNNISYNILLNIEKLNIDTRKWETYQNLICKSCNYGNTEYFNDESTLNLTKGIYRLKSNLGGFCLKINAQIIPQNSNQIVESDEKIGAGLRIKSIKKFNNRNKKVSHKVFQYVNSQGLSSGVLEKPIFNLRFNFRESYQFHNVRAVFAGCTDFNSISYLGSNSPTINYSQVTVLDFLNNGKQISYYTTGIEFPDQFNSNSEFPENYG